MGSVINVVEMAEAGIVAGAEARTQMLSEGKVGTVTEQGCYTTKNHSVTC